MLKNLNLLIHILLLFGPNEIFSGISEQPERYRLPKLAKPIEYDLYLDVYINEQYDNISTFNGFVQISLEATATTSYIILHSNELVINHLELKDENNAIIPVTFEFESTRNFLKISTKNFVLSQNTVYVVEIKFIGNLSTEDVTHFGGFYAKPYLNNNGEFS